MEFKDYYLTYEEYKALGGTLDLMPFNLLEYEIRRRIDIRTQYRLKNVDSKDIPQEVKLCEYAMMKVVKKYLEQEENISTQNIASENIDGYSVTYNNLTLDRVQEIVKSKNVEIENLMDTYLTGVKYNGKNIAYYGVD